MTTDLIETETHTTPIFLGSTTTLPKVVPEAQGPRDLKVEYVPKWVLMLTAWLGALTTMFVAVSLVALIKGI